MTFITVIMLINNTVAEKYMGRVNGFAQTLANLARGIGLQTKL